MLGDDEASDLGEEAALATWLLLPLDALFLIPMTIGLAWHVAAAMATPTVEFAWATHRTLGPGAGPWLASTR